MQQKVLCLLEIFHSSTLLLVSFNEVFYSVLLLSGGCDATERLCVVVLLQALEETLSESGRYNSPNEPFSASSQYWYTVHYVVQTLQYMFKYIPTYSHNIQLHCRTLKYYLVILCITFITQGNQLSASLIMYLYSFALSTDRYLLSLKHLRVIMAFKCWLVLHFI